jgi:histidyl-tRNA synthetase
MMLIALTVYRELGIRQFVLKVNSVGCQQCRPAYKKKLLEALQSVQSQLSPESQARVNQNPMRVLDSKDEKDQELTRTAPLMKDHLCPECSEHFLEVQKLLQSTETPFEIDGRLVRGLDYYTKTAFEITSSVLGSQDALAGGGRYDLLVEELGGKPTPGIGFAAGMERLMMVLAKVGTPLPADLNPILYIVTTDESSRRWAFTKATLLRAKGIRVEIDYLGRSVKAQMREANRQEARYSVVIGETEMQTQHAKLKNMKTGEEALVNLDELQSALKI